MPDVPADALHVGFIGTGLLGAPMVERLLDGGHHVTVWNRTPEKAAPLVARGAERADTPAALAQAVDVVVLCLTDTAAVDAVMFGPLGVASAMRADQLLMDCSSIAPDATAEMAARLHAASGARWIDAPVSGGVPAARAGTLIVFAGGDARDIARAEPLFAAISQRVTHMGSHGAGQLAKSCNQMIVGCNLMVIAEMLAFAERAGIDASQLPEALAGGFADSLPLRIFGPRMATRVDTPRIGAVATFRKDIEQVVRLGAEHGAALPMTTRAAELYRQAVADDAVGPDGDIARVIRLFARE